MLTPLFVPFSCKDSGKSDKYGNSEDNSNNNSPNGNQNLPGNAVKVNYTANPQPSPDTSASYHEVKKKAIEKK